ncbi:hypothetical protein D3C81_1183270 [compost metagenome]
MAISTAAVTRTIARSQNFDSSSCFGAGDDCGPFRCLGRKLTSVRSGFPSVDSWRSRSMESPRFHPERILAGVLGGGVSGIPGVCAAGKRMLGQLQEGVVESWPWPILILHNIHYAKLLISRLSWIWLWITSHLPSRPPKDQGEIEA